MNICQLTRVFLCYILVLLWVWVVSVGWRFLRLCYCHCLFSISVSLYCCSILRCSYFSLPSVWDYRPAPQLSLESLF